MQKRRIRMWGNDLWRKVLPLGLLLLAPAWKQQITVPATSWKLPTREFLWVDSVFQRMTLDERIGQLFMIRAHSDKGADHEQFVRNLIQEYHVGGLCFFQGSAARQSELIRSYQEVSSVPLLVSMDAEWGLGMRLKDDAISYPRQLTLGAIQDDRLIFEMGKEIGKQLKACGVHMNFAPVADINTNPANPVINNRSFGEDRENVVRKANMYAAGLLESGVIPCLKHFPGHGDTQVDSHKDLPVLPHQRQRLDSLELFPFRELAQGNIPAIMVAHLNIPALDPSRNMPATLSPAIIRGLLRKELQFKGLVITDAMEMKGVSGYFPNGEAEIRALEAGNDIVLLPNDPKLAIGQVKKAILMNRLDTNEIFASVKKVLTYKYRHCLGWEDPERDERLKYSLHHPAAYALKRKLFEEAVTVVNDQRHLLPLPVARDQKIATVAIGVNYQTPFQQMVGKFIDCNHYFISANPDKGELPQLIYKLRNVDKIIVSLHGLNQKAGNHFGISTAVNRTLEELRKGNQLVLVSFGNPYGLAYLPPLPCVVQAYEEDVFAQEAAAQALFGVYAISGKLPVSAGRNAGINSGLDLPSSGTLGFALPEQVGMWSDTFVRFDTIAHEMSDDGAAPGCVLLIAKDNRVVYQRAFGYKDYQKTEPMTVGQIFDLASVTKVAATTVSLMRMYDEEKWKLQDSLGSYLPMVRGTNKGALAMKDILLHRARLKAWIPFYERTILNDSKGKRPSPEVYLSNRDNAHRIEVADQLYMRNSYVDTIYREILDSDLLPAAEYKYSDLGFYLFNLMIHDMTGLFVDQYAQRYFYGPLGMNTTTFNPLKRFSKESIVPTEEDNYFRFQRLQGHVHDMGAAMLGGVSGHAGLFSNAFDLAKLMQMLLNGGKYGGKQMISDSTVRLFITVPSGNGRRALGFDTRRSESLEEGSVCSKASIETFGHTGFTGTCVWMDPKNRLVYILLANRTYPNGNNKKFINGRYRERFMNLIYCSLMNPVNTP